MVTAGRQTRSSSYSGTPAPHTVPGRAACPLTRSHPLSGYTTVSACATTGPFHASPPFPRMLKRVANLPEPPTTSTVVLAACGVSNSPTSLAALNTKSSPAPVVWLDTGELSLVNCFHTSFSSCLRAARCAAQAMADNIPPSRLPVLMVYNSEMPTTVQSAQAFPAYAYCPCCCMGSDAQRSHGRPLPSQCYWPVCFTSVANLVRETPI